MPGHVVHVAVPFEFEPALKVDFVLTQVDVADTQLLKTEFARLQFQRLGQFVQRFGVLGSHDRQQRPGTQYNRAMSAPEASLPHNIYSAAQVREFDRRAIGDYGIAGFDLMQRAGLAALDYLRGNWPDAQSLSILCGAGNNAGDGYVLAALARQRGLDVRVVAVVDPGALGGDAALAVAKAQEASVSIEDFAGLPDGALQHADLVVDALLGTGLGRDLKGPLARAVAAINASNRPVLALDIPTGLDSDTGAIRGQAVRADATITFVGLKTGLFVGSGPDLRGSLWYSDLSIPAAVFESVAPQLTRIRPNDVEDLLRPRSRTSHKGLNGRVLVIGGGPGMAGAARLAAEAALRSGAGLVHAVVAPENSALVVAGRPEIICRGVAEPDAIADWLAAADVIVAGPGLGRSEWADSMLEAALSADKPLVLDADGLNYLAESRRTRSDWVLTPHPGEAARLLGSSSADVQTSRVESVRRLAIEYRAITVLKGACSLVAQQTNNKEVSVAVCDYGNPGMATAGMGDVLAGILGGLVAQFGLSAQIVECGVLIHALAGDDAAGIGERGLIASDLFPYIRRQVNPV